MESEKKIEVAFESNVNDFRRILIWYHWKRLVLEYGIMMVVGIPSFYLLGFNLFDIKNNGWITFTFIIAFLLLLTLNILGLFFRQANKLKDIAEPAITVFTEQGLETKTKSMTSSRKWESYAKIFETKSDFIFFPQENVFAAVPKRFFKSQNQIDELRQLISEKLGARAKLNN